MRLILFLVLAVVVGLLMYQFPHVLDDENARGNFLYSLLLLGALIVGMGSFSRAQLPQTLKNTAVWLVVFAGLIVLFSLKDEWGQSRLLGHLLPSRIVTGQDGSLTVRASDGGHFFIDAKVNNANVRFMVDTGASDIVLSPRDAARAGFNPSQLSYTRSYRTANGLGGGASVTLRSLKVGDMEMRDIEASVNQADMDGSLLGMAFLNAFSRFEIQGDTLLLVP